MTTLRDRLVEIGAKIVRHGRSITFQMAEVMVSRDLFQQILDAIAALRRCRRRDAEQRRHCLRWLSAGELRSIVALASRISGRTAITDRWRWPRAPSRHFRRFKGRRTACSLPLGLPGGPAIWVMSD
jgi:hypothetical protein